MRDLHVVVVAARPEERPRARDALEVGRVDALAVEALELVRAEVVADDADDADVGEEARRQIEKCVAAPPRMRSRRPNGVSSESNATEPTTVTAI